MTKRKHTKLLHEGDYIAEVEIELIDSEEGWSPYLSLDDVQKLDEIRLALRETDLKKASKYASVYYLKPIAV
jgi:hypothetical protein